MLEDPALDAVYVVTPNSLHADQVVQAAGAGRHVLCDKPLATKADEAERAVAARRAAGVRDPALVGVGVGVTNNLGVHAYGLLRYLLGAEVVEATAVVDVEPSCTVDTMALALLRFDTGASAYVNANQSVPDSQPNLSIYGTEGTALGRNVTTPNLTGSVSVLGGSGSHRTPGLHRRRLRGHRRQVRRCGPARGGSRPVGA
jgi:predicted dehydrogenase